jgi:chromosome segregation ATPase
VNPERIAELREWFAQHTRHRTGNLLLGPDDSAELVRIIDELFALTAERDTQRARVEDLTSEVSEKDTHIEYLAAERDSLRAQVGRVKAVIDNPDLSEIYGPWTLIRNRIRRALEGT